jgi:hypothetical protein
MTKYDDIKLRVPVGCRELLQQHADEQNRSVNVVLNQLVANALGIDFEQWWYGEEDRQPRRLGQFTVLDAKFSNIFAEYLRAFCQQYRLAPATVIECATNKFMLEYIDKEEAKQAKDAGPGTPEE